MLSYNKKIASIAGIVVSVTVLWLLYKNFLHNQSLSSISDVNILYIVVAFFIRSIIYVFQSFRWFLIINIPGYNIYKLFSYIVIGTLPNFLLLNTGPLPRAFLLGYFSKLEYIFVLGTLLIEKLLDYAVITILVILFITVNPLNISFLIEHNYIISGLLFILFIILGPILFPIQCINTIDKIVNREDRFKYPRFIKLWVSIKEVLVPIKSLQIRLLLLFNTILIFLSNTFVMYIVMISIGIKLPFILAFFLQMTLLTSKLIPSVGELGVFQFICVFVLSKMSVDHGIAFNYSVLLYLVLKSPGMVLGALFIPNLKKEKL